MIDKVFDYSQRVTPETITFMLTRIKDLVNREITL